MWEFEAKKTDRLDRVLREEPYLGSEWISRQSWEWLFKEGLVSVSGRKVWKLGAEVSEGTKIQVSFPGPLQGVLPAAKEAKLLWSSTDRKLGLFAKETGISTVPLLPWDRTSFANQVAAFVDSNRWMSLKEFSQLALAPQLEGGLLQRLDRDTSGIICVAFCSEVKALFRQLFSQAKLEKVYFAIVSGPIDRLAGSHRIWLESSSGSKVKAHLIAPKGRAEEVLLNIEVCDSSNSRALIKVSTCHGSRHVVRASLAALACPLVGDQTYSGGEGADFHQLHAGSLRLLDSTAFASFPNGISADPPDSFLDSLSKLGLHWSG